LIASSNDSNTDIDDRKAGYAVRDGLEHSVISGKSELDPPPPPSPHLRRYKQEAGSLFSVGQLLSPEGNTFEILLTPTPLPVHGNSIGGEVVV
jgi:hypothetical protein